MDGCGFTMLEAGLVRSKNVSEIVTKNIGLYSIACVMYLVCGFYIMYPGDSAVSAYIPDFSLKYLGLTMGGQDKRAMGLMPKPLIFSSRLFLSQPRCRLFPVRLPRG